MSDISFYFVNPQGQVMSCSKSGQIAELTSPNFAVQLSCDGKYLWALTSEADPDGGGAVIKVKLLSGTDWTTISNTGPGAQQLCASGGGRCVYVTEDQQLWQVDATGEDFKQLPVPEPILQISSNMALDQPYYWGLFFNPNVEGGILKHTTDLSTWTAPGGTLPAIKQISVGAPGFAPGGNPCWYIDSDRQVVVIEPTGGPSNISEAEFALQVSASGNAIIYAVSTDINVSEGGNVIKSWNGNWSDTNAVGTNVAGVVPS